MPHFFNINCLDFEYADAIILIENMKAMRSSYQKCTAHKKVILKGNRSNMKRFVIIMQALICICLIAAGCAGGVVDVDINGGYDTPFNSITASVIPKETALRTDDPETTSPESTPSATEEPSTSVATMTPPSTPPHYTAEPTAEPTTGGVDKVVYLTFDDGPSPKCTEQLLDILDGYGIKATFFTVGYYVDRHPEVVRDAMHRGHLIACHTYTHEYQSIYASADAFMDDVHQWETAVENATGCIPECKIVRFPGGSNTSYLPKWVRTKIMTALDSEGYRYYDWFFGDNDRWPAGNKDHLPMKEYMMQSFEQSLKNAISAGKPLIFLAHDTCQESIELIPQMIDKLIEAGYTFDTLDSLDASIGFGG